MSGGRNCRRCGKVIPFLFPDGWAENTDNGLTVEFSGSYGEFIDTGFDGPVSMILCHECAHALTDWLGMDAKNWHTHQPGSGQHPDHHDKG